MSFIQSNYQSCKAQIPVALHFPKALLHDEQNKKISVIAQYVAKLSSSLARSYLVLNAVSWSALYYCKRSLHGKGYLEKIVLVAEIFFRGFIFLQVATFILKRSISYSDAIKQVPLSQFSDKQFAYFLSKIRCLESRSERQKVIRIILETESLNSSLISQLIFHISGVKQDEQLYLVDIFLKNKKIVLNEAHASKLIDLTSSFTNSSQLYFIKIFLTHQKIFLSEDDGLKLLNRIFSLKPIDKLDALKHLLTATSIGLRQEQVAALVKSLSSKHRCELICHVFASKTTCLSDEQLSKLVKSAVKNFSFPNIVELFTSKTTCLSDEQLSKLVKSAVNRFGGSLLITEVCTSSPTCLSNALILKLIQSVPINTLQIETLFEKNVTSYVTDSYISKVIKRKLESSQDYDKLDCLQNILSVDTKRLMNYLEGEHLSSLVAFMPKASNYSIDQKKIAVAKAILSNQNTCLRDDQICTLISNLTAYIKNSNKRKLLLDICSDADFAHLKAKTFFLKRLIHILMPQQQAIELIKDLWGSEFKPQNLKDCHFKKLIELAIKSDDNETRRHSLIHNIIVKDAPLESSFIFQIIHLMLEEEEDLIKLTHKLSQTIKAAKQEHSRTSLGLATCGLIAQLILVLVLKTPQLNDSKAELKKYLNRIVTDLIKYFHDKDEFFPNNRSLNEVNLKNYSRDFPVIFQLTAQQYNLFMLSVERALSLPANGLNPFCRKEVLLYKVAKGHLKKIDLQMNRVFESTPFTGLQSETFSQFNRLIAINLIMRVLSKYLSSHDVLNLGVVSEPAKNYLTNSKGLFKLASSEINSLLKKVPNIGKIYREQIKISLLKIEEKMNQITSEEVL
ncbi:MAG: hypothetical protein AAF443_03220 [Chlamydiota bacterium]